MNRICEVCGRGFDVHPYMVRKGHGRFCSHPCRDIGHSRARTVDVAVRLWAKTEKADGCWLWQGRTGESGHGRIWHNGRSEPAHHATWILAGGEPITAGFIVGHTCDTPNCVRNDDAGTYTVRGRVLQRRGHLFLGTPADNSADMVEKARQAYGDRSPSRKHPSKRPRGERHPNARFTDIEVSEMRSLYAAGDWSQRRLARRFSTSQPVIQRIVTGGSRGTVRADV